MKRVASQIHGAADEQAGWGTPGPGGLGLPTGLVLLTLVLASAVIPMGPSGQALASLLPSWPCLFQELTGWPCPFCGLTRSFLCMGQLSLAQALEFNAAGCVLFAFSCAYAGLGWACLFSKRRPLSLLLSKNHVPFLGMVVLIAWAIRMARLV